MQKIERVEVVIPKEATLKDALRKASDAIFEKRQTLEAKLTLADKASGLRAMSRLVEASPNLLAYDVWIDKEKRK